MDDLTRQREINRAAKVKEIFRNEIFAETLDLLRERYKSEWAATAPENSEARERLYYLSQALEEFHGHLRSVLETGQMADEQLQHKLH